MWTFLEETPDIFNVTMRAGIADNVSLIPLFMKFQSILIPLMYVSQSIWIYLISMIFKRTFLKKDRKVFESFILYGA